MRQTCFFILQDGSDRDLYITQDLGSLEFILDSSISTNQLELYIMNLENCILQLEQLNMNEEKIYYNFLSHSITVYLLKQLLKLNLVKINNLEKAPNKIWFDDTALLFLNRKIKSITMYDVCFELTDSKITVDTLRQINRKIGILDQSFIYNEKNGVFEYNRKYQFKKIIDNTFNQSQKNKGIVRMFDEDLKIWHLPKVIVKKYIYYFIGKLIYLSDDFTTEKVYLYKKN